MRFELTKTWKNNLVRSYRNIPIADRLTLSFPNFLSMSRRLAHTVLKSGIRCDAVVAIANKGLVPGKAVSDILQIPLVPVRIARESIPAGEISPAAISERYSALPMFTNCLNLLNLSGKKILAVDDNINTGGSILTLCERLLQDGIKPEDIKIAAISDMGKPKLADFFLTDKQYMTPGGYHSSKTDDLLYASWMAENFPDCHITLKK